MHLGPLGYRGLASLQQAGGLALASEMRLLNAGQDTFVLLDEDGEPMEWINMCWRKVHGHASFVIDASVTCLIVLRTYQPLPECHACLRDLQSAGRVTAVALFLPFMSCPEVQKEVVKASTLGCHCL